MGRPLTAKWTGTSHGAIPVLYPLVRINGIISRGYILKQVGADRFLVESADSRSKNICKLVNTDQLQSDGQMCLRFTGIASGFIKNLTDNKLRDFHGNSFLWNIYAPTDFEVYVYDNSSLADK
jgi:hypothetical protein